jgi:uncharacterized membrane protein
MTSLTKNRVESIDILRGIVMVIMALDHVRDYFHVTANTADPLDVVNLNTPLYFTRWVTHFCAPIFVFLSGTSIYLQSLRKTKKELGIFVIKRGLWLIFVEWTIVAFAWTFNPYFNIFPFQVIWAIGISMVLLGLLLLINTPYKPILIIGFLIVLGHNALDFLEADTGFKANFWWDILHSGSFKFYTISGNHSALLVYPFLPWTGLMILGYSLGKLFESNISAEERAKKLRIGGILLLLLFIAVRFTNLYGDPIDFVSQSTFIQSFLSFIKVNKYPPSLMFMCITIGIGMIALSYLENVKRKFTVVMRTYGRTAFFYYILHLYLIHLIAVAFYFIHGNTMSEVWNIGKNFPFLFVVPGQGESLIVVYIIWIAVVIALYPLCKWYDNYKVKHKENWWLSYL